MPSKTEEQRERAEAKFERLQKVAEEGRIAMAEYKAAALAMREKTARLRVLRLASEGLARGLPEEVEVPQTGPTSAKKSTKSAHKRTKKPAKMH